MPCWQLAFPGKYVINYLAHIMCGVCKGSEATAVVAAWLECALAGRWEALECGRVSNGCKRQ